MSADIHTFPPRPKAPHEYVYSAILMRDDVTIGDLLHALRFSGIVLTTDPVSGQNYIHRSNPPQSAA